jgi:hypothetical protein
MTQELLLSHRRSESSDSGLRTALKDWVTWVKLAGLTLVLSVLFVFDFWRLTFSAAFFGDPLGWVLFAFVASVLFGFFTLVSTWSGWRQWAAVFLVFYGVPYVLTVAEAPYLPSVLTASLVTDLLVNGAIVAGVFAAILVTLLGRPVPYAPTRRTRLVMPAGEWAWKLLSVGAVYLTLFFVFGEAVYAPLARAVDSAAYAAEQAAVPTSGAALVFPIEYLRGVLFAVFTVPAVMALPYSWRKTGAFVALLIGLPESALILLSTTLAPGLVPPHFVEVLGANLVLGVAMVWILQRRDRLPSLADLPQAAPANSAEEVAPAANREKGIRSRAL